MLDIALIHRIITDRLNQLGFEHHIIDENLEALLELLLVDQTTTHQIRLPLQDFHLILHLGEMSLEATQHCLEFLYS